MHWGKLHLMLKLQEYSKPKKIYSKLTQVVTPWMIISPWELYFPFFECQPPSSALSHQGFFFVDKRFEISNQNLTRDIILIVELGEIVPPFK